MPDAKTLKAQLNALIDPPAKSGTLPPPANTVRIPASVGLAPAQSGGGIASPLSEASHAARTYHAATTVLFSDGIHSLQYLPLNQIAMTDANGRAVTLEFDAP